MSKKTYIMKWYNRLLFRIPAIFILLFATLIVSITAAMKTIGKKRLEQQAYKLITQTGNTIVADVYSRTVFAESLAKAIANLAEKLPLDVNTHIEMVRSVLDINGTESFIAGGGVWPEPYKFSKTVKQRSFFWGRNEQGKLLYYESYNDPNGKGYHNEEWYVPAKHLGNDKDFWSKSYMDPYSYQPMVTCTVPIHRENQFYGVATVDFKLEGLGNFLEQASSRLGGYCFVVDRNGKFLSFPEESMVKKYQKDNLGNKTEEFITIDDLANKKPIFTSIAQTISSVNNNIKSLASQMYKNNFSSQLIKQIDADSYQINRQEAEMIAAAIADPLVDMNKNYLLNQFEIKDDILLHKPCTVFIFHVPHTYWKVISVIPIDEAIATSTHIYRIILLLIIGIVTATMLLCFVFFYRLLISPLSSMSRQLHKSVENNTETPEDITIQSKDEIGLLIYWFNQRNEQIAKMLHALRMARRNLEKRVEKRTSELKNVNQQLVSEIEERKKTEIAMKQLNVQLEEANNELKNFVYIASHDLREPLRTISSFGALLEKSLKDNLNTDDAQSLNYMIDGAKRMGNMIEGLLNYSRVNTRKNEFEKVELNNVVNELKKYELHVLLKETHTVINIPEQLPAVKADALQIRQLLQNLISNGIKYQPKGNKPVITITSKPAADGMVRIEVTDNGIGIAPQYHSAIFAMFKRLHNKKEYEGAGIGLAVCQKIILRHNGKIGVDSQSGKGSTFWFTLPADNTTATINKNIQTSEIL